jgi:putative DNA primase/helicase
MADDGGNVIDIGKRKPKKLTANEGGILKHLREAGMSKIVTLDTFSERIMKTDWLPGDDQGQPFELREVRPPDAIRVLVYLHERGFEGAQLRQVNNVLELLAYENRGSLLQEAFKLIAPWDGVPRIRNFYTEICGCQPEDDEHLIYLCEAARLFWLPLAARALEPGCKMDTLTIWEGPQGSQKSTLLKECCLRDSWFSEVLQQKMDRDFFDALKGLQIVELAEFRQKDADGIKAALSRSNYRQRSAWARGITSFPAQVVPVATVNGSAYLYDTTGNRRMIIVIIGHINLELLRIEKEQLYAEAIATFEADPESHWQASETFWKVQKRLAQQKIVTDDLMLSKIAPFLEERRQRALRGEWPKRVFGDELFVLTSEIAAQCKDFGEINFNNLGAFGKLIDPILASLGGKRKRMQTKDLQGSGYLLPLQQGAFCLL